jgi:hypothetical protein
VFDPTSCDLSYRSGIPSDPTKPQDLKHLGAFIFLTQSSGDDNHIQREHTVVLISMWKEWNLSSQLPLIHLRT